MLNRLPQFLREPLLHFLVLGGLLFVLFDVVSAGRFADDEIRVTRDDLVLFARHRYGKFGDGEAERFIDTRDQRELGSVIDDFVAEEAVYRKARSIGLDRIDYSARQRLVSQFEAMERETYGARAELDEHDINAWYEAHRSSYRTPAYFTFSVMPAGSKAGNVATRRYERASREDIADAYGEDFARQVEASPEVGSWQGPFASTAGQFMVRVDNATAPYDPPLDAIRHLVVEDVRADRIAQAQASRIEALRASYDVVLSPELERRRADTSQ
ncbi:MAG: peptidyl-prolyl cis-trans isomerase [Pseudomonadales bacterium]|nr:peptidyl-prolyl cis-trans isomerase [Pseudomonadales bacterium]